MNVMILAAGEGTRLRPYTDILPKPAIPFLNVPLAFYSVALLENIKINSLVVNTFHLPQKIHELFNSQQFNFKVNYSDETILLGNGGGLENAQSFFSNDDDIILMNGDEVILPKKTGQLQEAINLHKKNNALCTLLTMEHSEVGTRFGGVWLNKLNNVIGFGKEKPQGTVKGLHFIGVQILSKRIFKYLKPGVSNILYDGVTSALTANEIIQTYQMDCHWFETGNPTDFISATSECLKILAENKPPASEYLNNVLKQYSPTSQLTIINNKMILAAKGSQPGDFSKILGWLVLNEGAQVTANCHLRNVILNKKIILPEGTQAENKLFLD